MSSVGAVMSSSQGLPCPPSLPTPSTFHASAHMTMAACAPAADMSQIAITLIGSWRGSTTGAATSAGGPGEGAGHAGGGGGGRGGAGAGEGSIT